MRVFVAGATGVIGWRAVSQLVDAGHEVTGIARTPEKADLLRGIGATPVTVGLFDPQALAGAVAGHDAVVNLATKIPPLTRMARMSAWSENERLRREGSQNLVDAAIAAGARVFVQESLAFLYGEHGDSVIDASSADQTDSPFTEAIRIAEVNVARFTEHGGRGVVLRFGRFYAADSSHSQAVAKAARLGIALDVGGASGYAPIIDADDAAGAVVHALEAPAGVYDIVDDVPLERREQDRALARAVGRRGLYRAPAWMAPRAARHLGGSQRVSNRRYRDVSAWRPSSPSADEGWPKVVREMHVEPALPGLVRLLLWILAIGAVGVAVQATFFPREFYDDFPFGRGWVMMDGPYNEHLIRDVGALNLALLLLTLGSLLVSLRVVARLTAVAWLAWSVPHLVYHARHINMLHAHVSGGEKVIMLVSLAIPVAAAIAVWWLTSPSREPWRSAHPILGTRRPETPRVPASVGSER
jgi:nucleoside-diphosphate-sugar epimerase